MAAGAEEEVEEAAVEVGVVGAQGREASSTAVALVAAAEEEVVVVAAAAEAEAFPTVA